MRKILKGRQKGGNGVQDTGAGPDSGRYIRSGMEPERMDFSRTGKGDSRAAAEREQGMERALFVRVPAEIQKNGRKM